jgi:hypothetical protein
MGSLSSSKGKGSTVSLRNSKGKDNMDSLLSSKDSMGRLLSSKGSMGSLLSSSNMVRRLDLLLLVLGESII